MENPLRPRVVARRLSDGVGVDVRVSMRWAIAIATALATSIFAFGLLVNIFPSEHPPRLPLGLVAIEATVLSVLLGGLILVVASKTFVRANPDGLEVSDAGRRWAKTWAEIDDVTVAAGGGLRVQVAGEGERSFDLPFMVGPGGQNAIREVLRACTEYGTAHGRLV